MFFSTLFGSDQSDNLGRTKKKRFKGQYSLCLCLQIQFSLISYGEEAKKYENFNIQKKRREDKLFYE